MYYSFDVQVRNDVTRLLRHWRHLVDTVDHPVRVRFRYCKHTENGSKGNERISKRANLLRYRKRTHYCGRRRRWLHLCGRSATNGNEEGPEVGLLKMIKESLFLSTWIAYSIYIYIYTLYIPGIYAAYILLFG